MPTNNVLFWPKSAVKSNTFAVTDTPIRVIGNVRPGDQVKVWRVYDGTSDECRVEKIPPIPVMCCDTCSQLALWNEEYADCPTGFLIQSEILVKSSGVYFLEYCCAPDEVEIPENEPEPCTETPDGVYVWYREELIEGSECP